MARQLLLPIALLSVVPLTFIVVFTVGPGASSAETPSEKQTAPSGQSASLDNS